MCSITGLTRLFCQGHLDQFGGADNFMIGIGFQPRLGDLGEARYACEREVLKEESINELFGL